jgi:hypothetical protein
LVSPMRSQVLAGIALVIFSSFGVVSTVFARRIQSWLIQPHRRRCVSFLNPWYKWLGTPETLQLMRAGGVVSFLAVIFLAWVILFGELAK